MIKKQLALLLALILAASLIPAASLGEASESSAFEGVWDWERVQLVIEPGEDPNYETDVFTADVWWGVSADEMMYWHYETVWYDATTGGLVCEGRGIKQRIILHEGDDEEGIDTLFDDGSALFYFNEAGQLVWEDLKEEPGTAVILDRAVIPAQAPAAEEFANGYFRVLAGVQAEVASMLEGPDADALSLGERLNILYGAILNAFCRTAAFAADHQLWNVEEDAFSRNLESAWESLDQAEQNHFDEFFMIMLDSMETLYADWETWRSEFEPFALAEEMDEYVCDPLNRLAWQNLAARTLPLGSGDWKNVRIDYGASSLYTREEMDAALEQIRDEFSRNWRGFEMLAIGYAGDECNSEENLAWLNGLGGENSAFTQVILFKSDWKAPDNGDLAGEKAVEPGAEQTNWEWWLAREEGGQWQLMSWGFD